ncbi:hypothetical protein BDV10DRAFT_200439 [Aspergillus recurvatus]
MDNIFTDAPDRDPDLVAPVHCADFNNAVKELNLGAFYDHDTGSDMGQEQVEENIKNSILVDDLDADHPDVPATSTRVRPAYPTAPANKASKQVRTCAWVPYDTYRPPQNVQASGATAQQGPGARTRKRAQSSTFTPAPKTTPAHGSSSHTPNLASQFNHARTQLGTCKEIIKELQRVVKASSDGDIVRGTLKNAVAARDREAEASQRELRGLEEKCEKYKERWSREYARSQELREKIARYERELGKMKYQVKALQTQLKLVRSERDRLSGQKMQR